MPAKRCIPELLTDLGFSKKIQEYALGLKSRGDQMAFRKVLGMYHKLKDQGHGEFGYKSADALLKGMLTLEAPLTATLVFEGFVKKNKNHLLTKKVLNTALRAYSAVKDPRGQAEIFSLMENQNILPDVISFTEVIRCQHAVKDFPAAWDAYEEALRRRVAPDSFLYAILLRTVTLSVAEEKILPEMKKLGIPTDTEFILEPLMGLCAKENNISKAHEFFDSAPVKPPKLYKALIFVHLSCDDNIYKTIEILQTAKKNGIQFQTVTYGHVIQFCVKHYKESPQSEKDYMLSICEALTDRGKMSKDRFVNVVFMRLAAQISERYFKKQLGRFILRGFDTGHIAAEMKIFGLLPAKSNFKVFAQGGYVNWKKNTLDEREQKRRQLQRRQKLQSRGGYNYSHAAPI